METYLDCHWVIKLSIITMTKELSLLSHAGAEDHDFKPVPEDKPVADDAVIIQGENSPGKINADLSIFVTTRLHLDFCSKVPLLVLF